MTSGEKVCEFGEREVIRRISNWVVQGKQANGAVGVGDDCAVLDIPGAVRLVVTTDLLVQETHFIANASTDWEAVGRKAAAANVSDLSAMGAAPAGLLISVALPADFLMNDLLALYKGMQGYAAPLNAQIIGGDTTRSERICISVTALGWKNDAGADCLRCNAKPGDYLYVTGALGASRAGVEVLLKPTLREQSGESLAKQLIRCHHSPEARVDIGQALAVLFSRVAVIDISDSLFNEASLLAEASQVEILLYEDFIPVAPEAAEFCARLDRDAAHYALFSGEEYELLFALPVPPDELRDQLRKAGVECKVTQVGTVNTGRGVKLLRDGLPVDAHDETFGHFS